MASCSQVNSLFQAYIDGELGGAETRILEEHLSSCGACRREIGEQRACTERMVEALSDQRLVWGIRARVLAHLPEMEPAPHMHSHPTDPQHTRPRGNNLPWAVLGMAAAIVLVATAFLYNGNTESARAVSNPVGMVAFSDGNGVLRMAAGDDEYERAALKSLVAPGDRFETLSDGRLAFALIGASLVKVNHGSELLVEDNRRIRVDRGETFFDVGRDRRKFSVDTPAGEILVVGTSFLVDALPDSTVLTVASGYVLVRNGLGKSAVSAGQQLTIARGEAPGAPIAVDVAPLIAWADAIVPDPAAMALFRQTLERGDSPGLALSAEPIYWVQNRDNGLIESVILEWAGGSQSGERCSYFLHVSDGAGKLLMLDVLDGAVLGRAGANRVELPLPGGPLPGLDVLHIKLEPDYSTGNATTAFTVSALSLPNPGS